ncbi:MAG: ABC transporter permease [Chitinophagaceae bacterium]|jgi:Cu-processing system permease protein|nr:ABC transporter permease [Chitinophagaceae bacterium]MCU0403483.1 ABC transporter permease [Chitinophagaceae bacterium]
MKKITKYVLIDILRNRFMLAYTVVLSGISFSLFILEDSSGKALLGLMNVVLFIIPLVSLVFSTTYLYNAAEFIELMLSQPVRRKVLLNRIFSGLALSFVIATATGIGLPVLIYGATMQGLYLLLSAILLSVIFSALALLASVITRDKARGIGMALLLWVYFAFVFDGLVLLILFQFADYPLEGAMIAMTMLNPVDLVRIFMLLQVDLSAMMGITGAVFQKYFGSITGQVISLSVMVLWMLIPLVIAVKKFNKRDL